MVKAEVKEIWPFHGDFHWQAYPLFLFLSCFDWAVSPPLFHISCGGCCLGSMSASVRGRGRDKEWRPSVYDVFSGTCVPVGRETHICIWMSWWPSLECHFWSSKEIIAILQMRTRKTHFLCGLRDSILDNLVVNSDHYAKIFISIRKECEWIIINLKMEL